MVSPLRAVELEAEGISLVDLVPTIQGIGLFDRERPPTLEGRSALGARPRASARTMALVLVLVNRMDALVRVSM